MFATLRRTSVRLGLAACGALLALQASASISTAPRTAQWWDDQARILGGLPVTSTSRTTSVTSPALARHTTAMNQAWDAYNGKRLAPAQKFSSGVLGRFDAAKGPVFYPFGGPDAAWPLSFFPDASQYALIGLEPVGRIVDVLEQSEEDRDRSLEQMRRSLQSALRLSFFKTNDMHAELGRNRMSGVLPLLLALVARQGGTIDAVTMIGLDAEGRVVPGDEATPATGVRITFHRGGTGASRTLVYLRADLSNAGLAAAPQVARFVQSYPAEATMLKAASYLLHSAHFSTVRERILARSALVLQDDSGVPFRAFGTNEWATSLYGTYDGPIPLFSKRYQKDLREAYNGAVQPLDFGVGYDHRSKTSNLQLFVRQSVGTVVSSKPR